MRLKELLVRDRGVLQTLKLELSDRFLDRAYGLDFIVGVNGTGKSTVLRTIADLVDALGRGQELNFPFRLVLTPKEGDQKAVTLTNMDANENLRALPPDAPERQSTSLPQVILFSAGTLPDDRHETSAAAPEEASTMLIVERLQSETPGHVLPTDSASAGQPGPRPQVGVGQVLRITTEHLPLVMLCGWINDRRSNKGTLLEAFKGANVERICGFSLRLLLGDGLDEQDDTLARLVQASSRQVRNGAEYTLVFDERENPDLFTDLIRESGDGLGLYRDLLALFEQREGTEARLRVDIILERTGPKEAPAPLHLFEWLSDGEQAFLGRMALFPLLGETEAIVLLDEPENHFNDVWKREIIRFLDHSLRTENRSHIIISTHASITLTDVPLNHIHILQHDGCYTVDVERPSVQTFGVDASDIMSQVFGTPQSTGRFSAEHIRDRLNEIARSGSRKSRKDALNSLLETVGPGYWSYVIRQQLHREDVHHDS